MRKATTLSGFANHRGVKRSNRANCQECIGLWNIEEIRPDNGKKSMGLTEIKIDGTWISKVNYCWKRCKRESSRDTQYIDTWTI